MSSGPLPVAPDRALGDAVLFRQLLGGAFDGVDILSTPSWQLAAMALFDPVVPSAPQDAPLVRRQDAPGPAAAFQGTELSTQARRCAQRRLGVSFMAFGASLRRVLAARCTVTPRWQPSLW